jgi:histidinol-phosphatase
MSGSGQIMGPELALAHRLADVADAISMRHFRSASLQVETKGDGSPVTEVDRSVEAAMRLAVLEARPDAADGFLGEEIGASGSTSARWIFDGIDGTHNYTRGRDGWATMIAYEVEGIVVLGVVSSPARDRRWWAERDGGAWTATSSPDGLGPRRLGEPERLRCSQQATIEEATMLASPPEGFFAGWRSDAARALTQRTTTQRDSFAHVALFVASGQHDATVILTGGPWDYAATSVIVEESGGRFCDLWGGRRLDTTTAVFTNAHLERQVLALAAASRPDVPDTPRRAV